MSQRYAHRWLGAAIAALALVGCGDSAPPERTGLGRAGSEALLQIEAMEIQLRGGFECAAAGGSFDDCEQWDGPQDRSLNQWNALSNVADRGTGSDECDAAVLASSEQFREWTDQVARWRNGSATVSAPEPDSLDELRAGVEAMIDTCEESE